jgi:hypothetical protein
MEGATVAVVRISGKVRLSPPLSLPPARAHNGLRPPRRQPRRWRLPLPHNAGDPDGTHPRWPRRRRFPLPHHASDLDGSCPCDGDLGNGGSPSPMTPATSAAPVPATARWLPRGRRHPIPTTTTTPATPPRWWHKHPLCTPAFFLCGSCSPDFGSRQ